MVWEEFESEYVDLVSDVTRANYATYEQKLNDFIAHIDDCNWAAARCSSLAPTFDFNSWYDAALGTTGSMAGSGSLDWARDRKVRLGQQLDLFRYFAANKDAYLNFSANFMYSGSRLDDMIDEINSQIFDPFARDLLKVLRQLAPLETKSIDVPASDRSVSVDHNSVLYKDVEANLASLERIVQTSNALGAESPEERDRVVAEISAGRRLLKAARVRIDALWSILIPCLKWIGIKIADSFLRIRKAKADTSRWLC